MTQNPEAMKESTDTFQCMKQDPMFLLFSLLFFLNNTALRPLYEAGKVGLGTMAQPRGLGGVSSVSVSNSAQWEDPSGDVLEEGALWLGE